ncbi:hypothetical protein [Sphingomonas sp. SRS2]|uniref:hypothetical protein n=1 Tax=Sphingomonas sp. SRS2 TaxID=133190 RepID=UPI001F21C4FF|nr:hypothetical protein [Sphingomonas sp. SRS2]
MLLAPLTMAAACAPQPSAGQTVSHCEQEGTGSQHVPTKLFQCMGTCSTAVEVGMTRLAPRTASRATATQIPAVPSLAGILLERDTPPPRLS